MRRSLLALLLAAGLSSVGCGAADTVLERVRSDDEPVTPVVTIGVLAPLSGGQTRQGAGVLNAVEQAVEDSGGVAGWEIATVPVDLAGPDLESSVAEMVEDDTMVAVVTGFAADDIRRVVPALDEAGLTVLSPADADPRHVRGADPKAPLRPWSGYVTVAVDPAPEQAALAGHLVRAVGVTEAVVVTDGSSQSQTRAGDLVRALENRGVTAVTTLTWGGDPAAEPLVAAFAGLGTSGAVVVDAPPDVAADVAAARPSGRVFALMTAPSDLPAPVAAALEGALAAQPGLDPGRGGDELAAALQAGGRPEAVVPAGPAAYDGARLLVDAMGRCLPDPTSGSSPSRSACRAEVAGAEWSGLTGLIRFDEYGARLDLLPSVVSLRDGVWGVPGA